MVGEYIGLAMEIGYSSIFGGESAIKMENYNYLMENRI